MSATKMLDGQAIVVTGAGRGIGRAIAIQLAEAGAKVVVNDLGVSAAGEGSDASPAAEVVKEISESGPDDFARFHRRCRRRSAIRCAPDLVFSKLHV